MEKQNTTKIEKCDEQPFSILLQIFNMQQIRNSEMHSASTLRGSAFIQTKKY